MDFANFFIIIPLVGCALVGLTSLVSVMLNHQRKMAELIHSRSLDAAREQALEQELASLRHELRQLRSSSNRQSSNRPSSEVNA